MRQAYAGMSSADADGLRKSLQKKRPGKQLASYAAEFLRGAQALGREDAVTEQVWHMVMSFSGQLLQRGTRRRTSRWPSRPYLRANYPAEFIAAVLANGGGFYHPFAYVAEARRMGLTILPPDVNASEFRTTGNGREVRIGLQFINGLSAKGGDAGTRGRPYRDFADLRARSGLSADDLRTLIKAGACDGIAGGMTRPMMLWAIDSGAAGQQGSGTVDLLPPGPAAPLPRLPDYSHERRRQDEYAALGFLTAHHPMTLYADRLRRFRLVRSPDLPGHVGNTVLLAGMLTAAKPVHTAADEPMEFATFDDGHGLVETVLFPQVYRSRGHVLFDQGPFLLKGKVEEEFGAITVTITHLERVDRMLTRLGA